MLARGGEGRRKRNVNRSCVIPRRKKVLLLQGAGCAVEQIFVEPDMHSLESYRPLNVAIRKNTIDAADHLEIISHLAIDVRRCPDLARAESRLSVYGLGVEKIARLSRWVRDPKRGGKHCEKASGDCFHALKLAPLSVRCWSPIVFLQAYI